MSTSVTNLVTGLPGAGKTLFTITAVKEQAEKENRQVFYHGIKDLKLPWTPLEKPEEWPLVPPGSIVVLDEAQQLYRQRPAGSSVPPWVSALETLRHRGITLWLITQHPMLLDNHVRRLTGRHLHAIRRFGGLSANAGWSQRFDPARLQVPKKEFRAVSIGGGAYR
jgi:predicted AAA+ superfamily ATPase